MDIIIKTGFQKIEHTIEFHPQTPNKGKDLAKHGHVRDVEELRNDKISYLIQANVVRHLNVTKPPYAVKLKINTARIVFNVSCTCVYNKSKKCKHIHALIHFINNHERLTKTSFEKQWGNPTARQFAQEKYSKGADFLTLHQPKKVRVEPPPLNVLEKINHSCPLKNLLLVPTNFLHQRNTRNITAELSQAQVKLQKDYEMCNKLLEKVFELYQKYSFYKEVRITMTKELKEFYVTSIIPASREAIIQLCCDTLEQSTSDKWYAARRLRISASKNVHSIKTRKTKTIESLTEEMLYPKKVETTSTRYGKKNEKNACKQYESLYGTCVQHSGLVICEEQPWLCASPDGFVMKGDITERLVEFKCPYSCAKLPIVDYESKKCNVGYLKFKSDNTVELRDSNVYYTQCQVQMYVTGTSICDLFVYSPIENGSCCVLVERNENFLMSTIRKCENFYFEQYLPLLYNKIVVEPNKCTQPKRTFSGVNIVNTI